MSFDGADAAGFAVAARSMLVSTKDPSRIHFHLVASEKALQTVFEACSKCLDGIGSSEYVGVGKDCPNKPGVFCCSRQIHVHNEVDTSLRTMVGAAAKRISSPYNAARFAALDAMVGVAPRVAYMDPDIAVAGDVQELVHMDLQGHAGAMCPMRGAKGSIAPTMCSAVGAIDCQRDGMKETLASFGLQVSQLQSEWVGNAGIVVIDTEKWSSLKLGEAAREWMHRNKGGKLWSLGTQPPTNLALLGHRARMPYEWNTPWDLVGKMDVGSQGPKLMHFKGPWHKAWGASKENWKKVQSSPWAAQRYYDLSVIYHETCYAGTGTAPSRSRGKAWSWDSKSGVRVAAAVAGRIRRQADPHPFTRDPVALVVVVLEGDEAAFARMLQSAE